MAAYWNCTNVYIENILRVYERTNSLRITSNFLALSVEAADCKLLKC